MKFTQIIPFLIALLGFILAPICYWCIYSNGYCYATWIHYIYPYFINPFYNFSPIFLPIALVLAFVPRSIFNSWIKFAMWAIPLSVIFIAFIPVSSSGAYLDLFPFYRDDAARLAGQVFTAVSLILIVWKWFSARRTKNQN